MSRLFSVLAPQWWNELPANVRTAESLAIFHKRFKTHWFRLHLDLHWMTPLPVSNIPTYGAFNRRQPALDDFGQA